jgi:predicted CXXCH cytochrome family protein
MKECESCHSWSAEKHAVVVEKGVPGACYDCHSEKQAQVDSSKSAHPVAGECLTCHSPHGTDQNHLVKSDIYGLCTSCHEDQKINHPVGRHPLRFAKVKNGSELSCVTCHNPHGSENEKLLRFAGSSMEVCAQCH